MCYQIIKSKFTLNYIIAQLLITPCRVAALLLAQYCSFVHTEVVYLDYPVLGQQACPLSWRVLIHSSDVLARPCPLTVQIEAISIGPSLDHTETWSQFRTHLLKGERGHRQQT